jgi:hypothetical protein
MSAVLFGSVALAAQSVPEARPSKASGGKSSPQEADHGKQHLDLKSMAQMEAAGKRARRLYEMDTVAWTGSDALMPVLMVMRSELPGDIRRFSWVQWKDEGGWTLLFFYALDSGETHPVASVHLSPPLTRQSRGPVKTYKISNKDPMPGDSAKLAAVAVRGSALFEKATGLPLRPPLNHYTVLEPDGTGWFYVVSGDAADGIANAGPTFAVHLDASAEKVLEQRQSMRTGQTYRYELASGQNRLPGKPALVLDSPLPEPEDLLFLLLHPDLSPLIAETPSGNFVLRAGTLPEFRGAQSVDSIRDDLASTPPLPAGPPVAVKEAPHPKDKPKLLEEANQAVQERARDMYVTAYLVREARRRIAGSAACFPANSLTAVVDIPTKDEWYVDVDFVSPGSEVPCLAVRASIEKGRGGYWTFEIPAVPPPTGEHFTERLAMVRAAKEQVGAFLGPGSHYFMPQIVEDGKSGMVFAWSEMGRALKTYNNEDRYLVGSLVVLNLAKWGESFKDIGDFVLSADLEGWDTRGVPKDMPLGIRSAERGYPGEAAMLRCKLNPWLLPRLIRNGGNAYLVQKDGTYKKLKKREAARLEDLPEALFPKIVYKNEDLLKFWRESPSAVNRSEAPPAKETEEKKDGVQDKAPADDG